MSVKIQEQIQGGVTILRIEGRLTLGEGDQALRAAVARALEDNRRKILLDLAEVPYLDSAGLGELVGSFTRVSRAGGKLSLCHPTKKLTDLLTITKLLTVFEVFDSIEAGVRALGGSVARAVSLQCPVSRCGGWVKLPPAASQVDCPECGAKLTLEHAPAADQATVVVRRVVLPSYEGEQVTLEAGAPAVLGLQGRLDLFAAEVLERAWRTLAQQSHWVLDLSQTTELSEAGLAALVALRGPAKDVHIALALGKRPEAERWREALSSLGEGPVFEDVASAARSLDLPPTAARKLEVALRSTPAG